MKRKTAWTRDPVHLFDYDGRSVLERRQLERRVKELEEGLRRAARMLKRQKMREDIAGAVFPERVIH